jgi:hypothetical protein
MRAWLPDWDQCASVDDGPQELRLAEGHAIQDAVKCSGKPDSGKPGRRSLVDKELVDQLLGRTQAVLM